MNTAEMNLMDWQERFGSEATCAQALARQRWPEGFRCPRCGQSMDAETLMPVGFSILP